MSRLKQAMQRLEEQKANLLIVLNELKQKASLSPLLKKKLDWVQAEYEAVCSHLESLKTLK